MEQIWSIMCTMTAGLMVAGLSTVFLEPVIKIPDESSRGISLRNEIRSLAGILATAALIMVTTSSVRIAISVGTAPIILRMLLFTMREKRRKERRRRIMGELPTLLDYLVLQIESGQSLQHALRSSTLLFPNVSALHRGLWEMNENIKVGSSMEQALEKFGRNLDTPEAEAPVMAINHALRYGTPLGRVLREQSKRMREHLILEGEQFANTVSVKILIPLLFCVFPASFLVIFSPVIVSLTEKLP